MNTKNIKVTTSLLGAILLSAMAISSSTLFAADGITSITQRGAMSGRDVPGDAPGFPVTITRPGSYRLEENLVVPDSNTTAIQILADNVSLDLNGFSILGPNVCSRNPTVCNAPGMGLGVQAGTGLQNSTPVRGSRVFNGYVRGMGSYGIRMQCEGCTADRIYAESNGATGLVVGDSVTNSVARRNGALGIVSFMVSNSSAIENQLGGIGIPIEGGVASGNFSRANGGFGLLLNGAATVTGNNSSFNTGYGISAQCPSNISGNTTAGNQQGSIQTLGAACLVSNNAQ